MNLQRFHYLLLQFKEDGLSEEEGLVFREMLLSGEYDGVVEADFLELLKTYARHEEWTPDRETALLNSVQEKLEFTAARGVYQTIVPIRGKWIRYAAAAVVIVTVGVAGYVKYGRVSPGTAGRSPSVAPGGSKAMLTLGDGTRIAVDSTGSGTVAIQGGVQVIKLASGLLTYKGAATGSTVLYNKLETPKGGEYQLILPDGTHAWLNAASSIRYPQVFTGTERRVDITGEVYLQVARDSKMPFVATARGTAVTVLGTGFDLMAYEDEGGVRTTLVDGAVRVSAGGQNRVLKPGDEAALDGDRILTSKADLSQVLAWKEGRFRFEGAKITAIMRQIARWYDVDIEYQGRVPDNEFNGSIERKADAAAILETLEITGNVHFDIKGNKVIVMPGPR